MICSTKIASSCGCPDVTYEGITNIAVYRSMESRLKAVFETMMLRDSMVSR